MSVEAPASTYPPLVELRSKVIAPDSEFVLVDEQRRRTSQLFDEPYEYDDLLIATKQMVRSAHDLNSLVTGLTHDLPAAFVKVTPGAINQSMRMLLPKISVFTIVNGKVMGRGDVTVYPDARVAELRKMYEAHGNETDGVNVFPGGTQNDLEQLWQAMTPELFIRWAHHESNITQFYFPGGRFQPRFYLYRSTDTFMVPHRSERGARIQLWRTDRRKTLDDVVFSAKPGSGITKKLLQAIEEGQEEVSDNLYDAIGLAIEVVPGEMDSLQIFADRPVRKNSTIPPLFEETSTEGEVVVSASFLRDLRKTRGWTLAEAGRRIRLSQATLSAMELGKFTPTYSMLTRLPLGWDLTPEEWYRIKKLFKKD